MHGVNAALAKAPHGRHNFDFPQVFQWLEPETTISSVFLKDNHHPQHWKENSTPGINHRAQWWKEKSAPDTHPPLEVGPTEK